MNKQRQTRVFSCRVWMTLLAVFVAGLARTRLRANEKPVTEPTKREVESRGFLAAIDQVRLVPAPPTVEKLSQSHPPQDVDLVGMARRAMHYLINNPSKARGYSGGRGRDMEENLRLRP